MSFEDKLLSSDLFNQAFRVFLQKDLLDDYGCKEFDISQIDLYESKLCMNGYSIAFHSLLPLVTIDGTEQTRIQLRERILAHMPKPKETKTDTSKNSLVDITRHSGYIYFCDENRQKMKDKYPQLSALEITVKLSDIWKSLSSEKQKKWNLASEKL